MTAASYAVEEARRLAMAVSTERASPEFASHCAYCGVRCYGKACRAHTDLLLIEQQAMRAA